MGRIVYLFALIPPGKLSAHTTVGPSDCVLNLETDCQTVVFNGLRLCGCGSASCVCVCANNNTGGVTAEAARVVADIVTV